MKADTDKERDDRGSVPKEHEPPVADRDNGAEMDL